MRRMPYKLPEESWCLGSERNAAGVGGHEEEEIGKGLQKQLSPVLFGFVL